MFVCLFLFSHLLNQLQASSSKSKGMILNGASQPIDISMLRSLQLHPHIFNVVNTFFSIIIISTAANMSLLPALLCLAILAGVGHCGTGRRASYNNGPRHDGCRNPPPGVMKMARGIDITEFEPCPLEPVGTSGFRSPVVHMGCQRNRPWVTDGVEYNTPDEVRANTGLTV